MADSFSVSIDYIGSDLSVNHCYVRNRRRQNVLKQTTKTWMMMLKGKVIQRARAYLGIYHLKGEVG